MIAGYASLGILLSLVVLTSVAMKSSVPSSALAHVLPVSKQATASVSVPKSLLATTANTAGLTTRTTARTGSTPMYVQPEPRN